MTSEHKGRLFRLPDTSPGIAYWDGALEAGLRECAKLEAALGLPHGVHIPLYYRLEQWRDLLNALEEVTEGNDSS